MLSLIILHSRVYIILHLTYNSSLPSCWPILCVKKNAFLYTPLLPDKIQFKACLFIRHSYSVAVSSDSSSKSFFVVVFFYSYANSGIHSSHRHPYTSSPGSIFQETGQRGTEPWYLNKQMPEKQSERIQIRGEKTRAESHIPHKKLVKRI